MLVRGIRGAITVKENTKKDILADTKELLLILKKSNDFNIEDIVSIFFSTTLDLDSAFPAAAARELGWSGVPLFGMQEANVQIGLKNVLEYSSRLTAKKNKAR